MIKINLLPTELKSSKSPQRPHDLKIPELGPKTFKVAGYILAILITCHILLIVSIIFKSISLRTLEQKWQFLQPQKTDVEKLNSEVTSLERKFLPVKRLIEERDLWSKRLNRISDLMTTGIWLNKLFIQTQITDSQKAAYVRVLNLEGCAASIYGDETSLIAKFTKGLQEDQEFLQYFRDIKLGPMEKSILDKVPIMNFKITCFFRED